jgi:prevent-host-death family protein
MSAEKLIVNVHEAKTHLSRLLERVANGEQIIIAKSGKPVATLSPFIGAKKPRKPGAWKGKVWLADDWDSDEVNREIEDLFYGSEIEPSRD